MSPAWRVAPKASIAAQPSSQTWLIQHIIGPAPRRGSAYIRFWLNSDQGSVGFASATCRSPDIPVAMSSQGPLNGRLDKKELLRSQPEHFEPLSGSAVRFSADNPVGGHFHHKVSVVNVALQRSIACEEVLKNWPTETFARSRGTFPDNTVSSGRPQAGPGRQRAEMLGLFRRALSSIKFSYIRELCVAERKSASNSVVSIPYRAITSFPTNSPTNGMLTEVVCS
jgi:hypothetical protein